MALTVPSIKTAKPGDKARKLADGDGLYLLINPSGSRWWRLKYRYSGEEKLLHLGSYPITSLASARRKRAGARRLLASGVDPGEYSEAESISGPDRAAHSFEVVAREWFVDKSQKWPVGHADKIISRLERHVFPWIGARAIADLTAPELLGVLQRIEACCARQTAHRALQNCGQVFRYAIVTGRTGRDPSADLRGMLERVASR